MEESPALKRATGGGAFGPSYWPWPPWLSGWAAGQEEFEEDEEAARVVEAYQTGDMNMNMSL